MGGFDDTMIDVMLVKTGMVTIHGAVRPAARPPSDKVMVSIGHPANCRRQF